MKRTAVLVAAVAVSTLGLGACSSDTNSSEETAAASAAASPDATMVGGTATCDEASLSEAITGVLDAGSDGEKLFSLDGFECADGWAATFPTVGTAEDNAYTMTMVFEAEGQFWVEKDRGEVCGTQNMDDLQAYPDDAQVPEAIYQPACNTN